MADKDWKQMSGLEQAECAEKISKGYPPGHNQIPKIQDQADKLRKDNKPAPAIWRKY